LRRVAEKNRAAGFGGHGRETMRLEVAAVAEPDEEKRRGANRSKPNTHKR
jgi:hypothetical protein